SSPHRGEKKKGSRTEVSPRSPPPRPLFSRHYARAWSTMLLGGGVPGGQVISRTDKNGATVEDRPVSAVDFMATICRPLGIDPETTFHAGDRPVRMVDKGANPIPEVLA
ncbi:MAG: DUF1501 domain-containing protein, partial [Gemmataceae bacterium]